MNMPITQDSSKILEDIFQNCFLVSDIRRVQLKTVSAGINLHLKLGQSDLTFQFN